MVYVSTFEAKIFQVGIPSPLDSCPVPFPGSPHKRDTDDSKTSQCIPPSMGRRFPPNYCAYPPQFSNLPTAPPSAITAHPAWGEPRKRQTWELLHGIGQGCLCLREESPGTGPDCYNRHGTSSSGTVMEPCLNYSSLQDLADPFLPPIPQNTTQSCRTTATQSIERTLRPRLPS